jgi:hypothetical protein
MWCLKEERTRMIKELKVDLTSLNKAGSLDQATLNFLTKEIELDNPFIS